MKVELDIPDSALSALRQAPHEFAACTRLMAAAKLYEIGSMSQERAGLIPSATQALEAVVAAGLFITKKHLDAIRSQAGEL